MRILFISIVVVLLFLLNIFIGSANIPFADVVDILFGGDGYGAAEFIVMGSRLPMALTALIAGAGLAVSGLMLQTLFRNPLAGPSVLGINSGASLGVALVMLFFGGSVSAGQITIGGYAAVILGAFAGSAAIMAVLVAMSSVIKNDLMLLITGIMIGYLASSVIMLLNFVSSAEGVHNYVMWGMSSFNGVSMEQMPLFAGIILTGGILSMLLVKPLNALLLGQRYAANLGVNIGRVRNLLLLATGILSAGITSYCGPVAFIGLAVPHIARMIFRTDNHRILMPASMLIGGGVTLGCSLLCIAPSSGTLPVNAVTPLIGAPVVIWVLFRHKK